jgi:hypothetical protein
MLKEVTKMSRLKAENLKQCVSLLREFIDGTGSPGERKEIAILALNQLQNITAGTNSQTFSCTYRLRVDGRPVTG